MGEKKLIGMTRIGTSSITLVGGGGQTHPTKYRKFSLWQKIYSPFENLNFFSIFSRFCLFWAIIKLKI